MMQINVLNSSDPKLETELSIEFIRIDPMQMDYPATTKSPLDDSFEVLSLEKIPTNKELLKVFFDSRTSTVTCAGVQISHIVCSSTTATTTAALNQLFPKLQFIPYIGDTEHLAVDTKLINHVTNYLTKCKDLSMQILSRADNIRTNPYNNNNTMPEGKVLNLLTQAALMDVPQGCTYTQQVNKLFLADSSLFRAIQEDQVINSLPYDRDFKIMIDTVVENMDQSSVLRVLEISSSVNKFYGLKLSKIMQENYPGFAVDYKFASVLKSDNLAEIAGYLKRRTSMGVQFLDEWCILKGDCLSKEVPEGLKRFDLVVFNTCLSAVGSSGLVSKREMKDWIGMCAEKMLKPRGFMLVHEFTENLENMQVISKLELRLQANKSSKNKGNYVYNYFIN